MSSYLKLNADDSVKGLVVLAISVILSSIGVAIDSFIDILGTGALPTMGQIKVIATTSLLSTLSYLAKNLFTNSEGKIFITEPKADKS